MTSPSINEPLGEPVVVQGETELYGRGWAFPFQFDRLTASVAKTAGQLSVEEAFIFILGTFVGERVMKPAFGSKISSVLFELNTSEAKALLRTFVNEAASQEPRISAVHKIDITTDPADPQRLNISITFRLIQQTSERNIVIPILRGAQ